MSLAGLARKPTCATCPGRPEVAEASFQTTFPTGDTRAFLMVVRCHGAEEAHRAVVAERLYDLDRGRAEDAIWEQFPRTVFLKNWAKCELARPKREIRIT